VGPKLHEQDVADMSILVDFAGHNMTDVFQNDCEARNEIKQFIFAVFLKVVAMRGVKVTHCDLSTNNVCYNGENESVQIGKKFYNVPTVRIIDCGFSYSIYNPNSEDIAVNMVPQDWAKDVQVDGMLPRSIPAWLWEHSAKDKPLWHCMASIFFRAHPYLDMLQFLISLHKQAESYQEIMKIIDYVFEVVFNFTDKTCKETALQSMETACGITSTEEALHVPNCQDFHVKSFETKMFYEFHAEMKKPSVEATISHKI
jgi:hypothetical protein